MAAAFLCFGDLHLGRRPTRLPAELAGLGLLPADLTPAAAWRAGVQWACEHAVDAVVLAGDVVERYDDRFEAFAHLANGVQQLVAARIPVYAVAGNHDSLALPRLADQIPEVVLLGRGGVWEHVDVDTRAGAPVRLLGWSFTDRFQRESPLRGATFELDRTVPTLGILHADLDAAGSPYAPVSSAELKAVPADAWLLGHVHMPSDLQGPRPIGYLGSVTGLDPGEPGPHGPWLVEVAGVGHVEARQIPLAPLRWERQTVPIDAIAGHDDESLSDALFATLVQAMTSVSERIEPDTGSARAVGCRLRLTGRSACHRELRRLLRTAVVPPYCIQDAHYFIEKLIDESAAETDLTRLASGSHPPNLLAARLLALREGDPAAAALLARVGEALREAGQDARWTRLAPIDDTEDDIRALLLDAGGEALEELLAQAVPAENAEGVA